MADDEGGGAPAWMISFGDMMTLILTFFILLVSMSKERQQGLVARGVGSFMIALRSFGTAGDLDDLTAGVAGPMPVSIDLPSIGVVDAPILPVGVEPNGFIMISDRAKDVIKSGGEWISSVDLENTLMGHDAVREAAVIGVPDDRWDERPLACVVLADGATATAADLNGYLADKVAKWWLPERWTFIDEVPKTSVGKFDKKVLRGRYAEDELTVETLG